jgi:internalin A
MKIALRLISLCAVFLAVFECSLHIYNKKDSANITIKSKDGKEKVFPKESKFMGFEKDFYFDLSSLSAFPNVESLELLSPDFKDEDLRKIPASLSKLEYLNLSGTQLNHPDYLIKFPKLQSLILSYSSIDNLSEIKKIQRLTRLSLNHTKISFVDDLRSLKELKHLDLRNTEVADIRAFANLKKLVDLQLGNTKVKNLSSLVFLKDLIYLEIDNLEISESEIKSLKNANPYLKIVKWN